MNLLFFFLIFIFGLIIGSFLNVLIYRIPINQSIILPRSYCPHCHTPIKATDNIPILSFIFLKGKCRFCKKKISYQYPLVELLTAILFIFLFKRFYFVNDFISLGIYIVYTSILIVISFIDINHYIIPDILNFSLLFIGFFSSFFIRFPYYGLTIKQRFLTSFLSLFIAGLIWFLISYVGNKIYLKKIRKEALGLGDVKLFIAIGSFLNLKLLFITMYLAVFIAGFSSIFIMIIFKKGLRDHIPLGPFISIAAILIILFNNEIINIWNFIFQYY
ncbi:MAG TPA: prepilin peptidase [bacterium]|nr:prepilin peptidase [bacterium]HOL48835.1 prepilin peptidase [bacterium]HPQ19897.1 prepilin peptidase [bacterium]